MKRFSLILITVLLLGLLGCGDKGGEENASSDKELMLYCGAGIRPPVEEIAAAFEAEYDVGVVTDFRGSETLLSTIKLARSGDLYLPGDKHYIRQAAAEDMIASSREVFYWVPVILVKKGNPRDIGGIKDLAKEGVKVGLGDPLACAIGRTTEKVLEKNGMSRTDLGDNLKYQSQTVNELGLQIQAGSLDAVIVWDAMARYYEEYGEPIPIETDRNVISSVDIGLLEFADEPELAEQFVDFITSEKGRAIFQKHGYTTPAGE